MLQELVVGQDEAKKKLSLALISRARKELITNEDLRENVKRQNVMLIGKTGTGKTELSRSLSKISGSPFVKADATKFTEVGYVGSDVENMVKELAEAGLAMQKKNLLKDQKLQQSIAAKVNKQIIVALCAKDDINLTDAVYEDMVKRLEAGEFNSSIIEVSVEVKKPDNVGSAPFDVSGLQGIISMLPLDSVGGSKKNSRKVKKLTVSEARDILMNEEKDSISSEDCSARALADVQKNGIIFIDEIDKLISSHKGSSRGDVSREGVQRDLLSIIDGTTVQTKLGDVSTDNILFICAGAFESAKPSDLLPELQGRFPISAKLKPLSVDDLKDILVKPKYSLLKQQVALMETEGGKIEITDEAILEIAKVANLLNTTYNNTGARRLQGVVECVFEEVSFNGFKGKKEFSIDKDYVVKVTKKLFEEDSRREDLYIL